MKASNKTIGNRFEAELCEMFAEAGWWAHNLAQNQVGQPADVIAVRNNTAVLIDCKDCENDRFPLSRIETNQEGAMTLWEMRGNAYCYFALRISTGIYMIDFDSLCEIELYGKRSLNADQIAEYPSFSEWLERMSNDT